MDGDRINKICMIYKKALTDIGLDSTERRLHGNQALKLSTLNL
jgi:hypothetical protein